MRYSYYCTILSYLVHCKQRGEICHIYTPHQTDAEAMMEIGKPLAEKCMRNILLVYGRIFGLYWNGICAILSEGIHNNNTRSLEIRSDTILQDRY